MVMTNKKDRGKYSFIKIMKKIQNGIREKLQKKKINR